MAEDLEKAILVVDDERDVLLLFHMLLKRKFQTCHVAVNGNEALEIIRQGHHIDCVITDISMPDMDGFQLKAQLDVLLPEVPVIGVTGHSDEEFREKMYAAGFKHIVVKPVDRNKLHQILDIVARSN